VQEYGTHMENFNKSENGAFFVLVTIGRYVWNGTKLYGIVEF